MAESGNADAAARALLLRVVDSGFDKTSWHGPNLWNTLKQIDATAAAVRVGRRKTIWQQALHAAYWKHRVLVRLAGKRRFPRSPSDWPDMPVEPTPEAWGADLALLADTHAELRRAVEQLDDARWNSKAQHLIYGVAAHDVYHAGQIKLLRRLIADREVVRPNRTRTRELPLARHRD